MPEVFDARMEAAFRMLEGAVQSGRIGAYGIASWNAFRAAPDQPAYMALSHAKALAQRAADGKPDHFHYVQMPLNLAMTEGLTSSTQKVGGKMYPAVRAATLLGLRVMASGAIRQAKLGTLPSHVNKALGEDQRRPACAAVYPLRAGCRYGTCRPQTAYPRQRGTGALHPSANGAVGCIGHVRRAKNLGVENFSFNAALGTSENRRRGFYNLPT